MFTKCAVSAIALLVAVSVAPMEARADDGGYKFKTIDVPAELGSGVYWLFINNRGQLVANYQKVDSEGNWHSQCALVDDGTWTVLMPPGYTDALGSNPNDKGEVALNVWGKNGSYFSDIAFYKHGHYEISTNIPGDTGNFNINGLNDRGWMCGEYDEGTGVSGSFLFDGREYTLFNYAPDELASWLGSVNKSGVAVGASFGSDYVYRAFKYHRGQTTPIDPPPGSNGLAANGINNHGDMCGANLRQDGVIRGFFLRDGRFTDVIVPGTALNNCLSINDRGQITGRSWDSNGVVKGYVATPKH